MSDNNNKLKALLLRLSSEFKKVYTHIGNPGNLITTEKRDVVRAINEVKDAQVKKTGSVSTTTQSWATIPSIGQANGAGVPNEQATALAQRTNLLRQDTTNLSTRVTNEVATINTTINTKVSEINTRIDGEVDDLEALIESRVATRIPLSALGEAGGPVPLDENRLVPAAFLPSYVDDVMEFPAKAQFPNPGERGKIYVDLATDLIYRWSGTVYAEISQSPGSTDAVPEGAANLYFTLARVRATALAGLSTATNAIVTASDTVLSAFGKLQKQISDNLATLTSHIGNTSNPHGTTKVHVGLGNVDNTSDANKPVSTATNAAINNLDTKYAGEITRVDGRITTLGTTLTSDINAAKAEAKAMISDSSTAADKTWSAMKLSAELAAKGGVKTVNGQSPNASGVVTIPAATTTASGVMSAADKVKLNGIAAGATVNATDAALRDRGTHTGTQAISTVTGLQTALDGKATTTAVEAAQTTANQAKTAADGANTRLDNLEAGGSAVFDDAVVSSTKGWSSQKISTELATAGKLSGPAATADNEIPIFSGTDGRVLKNSGLTLVPGLPRSRPLLRLPFANAQWVDPRVVFTRSSTGYAWNARGQLVMHAVNVPRIDFDPRTGECYGLLIESDSANSIPFSHDFTSTAWLKGGASVATTAIPAPDPTSTWQKLVESSTNENHYINPSVNSTTVGTRTTTSIFVMAGERYKFLINEVGSNAASRALFDLSTKSVIEMLGAVRAGIEDYGNGVFRCWMTYDSASGNVGFYPIHPSATSWTQRGYQGDGASGLYIWGAQNEAMQYMTSYIPRPSSAAASRANDLAYIATDPLWFNGATLSISASFRANRTYFSDEGIFFVRNNSAYLGFGAKILNTRTLNVLSRAAGNVMNTANVFSTVFKSDDVNKMSASFYGTGQVKAAMNGITAPETYAGPVALDVNRIELGRQQISGSLGILDGHILDFAVWPRDHDDAQHRAVSAN